MNFSQRHFNFTKKIHWCALTLLLLPQISFAGAISSSGIENAFVYSCAASSLQNTELPNSNGHFVMFELGHLKESKFFGFSGLIFGPKAISVSHYFAEDLIDDVSGNWIGSHSVFQALSDADKSEIIIKAELNSPAQGLATGLLVVTLGDQTQKYHVECTKRYLELP